jgi:putative membrane protein
VTEIKTQHHNSQIRNDSLSVPINLNLHIKVTMTKKFFDNEKVVFRIVAALSVFVFVLVLVLNRKFIPRPDVVPSFAKYLPFLNACINGTCSVLLLISLYHIRRKNIETHKKINLTAFFLSVLFLISYVTYHYLADETKFPADNPARPVYLFILISHIILAALVLPLVLLSFYYGLKMEVKKHKRLTRWSYPIWLYVTVTGVIVYLMISPFYTLAY